MEVIREEESIYDKYSKIINYMKGLQIAEKLEESEKEIQVTRTETESHFVFHFVFPQKEKEIIWGGEHQYNLVFGIYCPISFQIIFNIFKIILS